MALTRVLVTVAILACSLLVHVVRKGYRVRSRIYKLKQQGVPMPPWHWFFGHLLVLKQALDKLPPDANVYYAMKDFSTQFADTEIFLIDLWPVFEPVYMLSGPELSAQVSSMHNLPKPDSQSRSMLPITGGESLISMNDHDWKFWRSLLNPGFSASVMRLQMPMIVDAVGVLCEELREKVDGGVFSLDDMTTRLTMDIITRTSLDTDLDNQRTLHPLTHSLNTILAWHSFWDPRILLNPLRPFIQWYHGRMVHGFILKRIKERFEEMKAYMLADDQDGTQSVSVISLALQDHIHERTQNNPEKLREFQLDDTFASLAANQVRLLLFAGNDSTSSSMVYSIHLLSQHPQALRKLREEHDAVFGDPSQTFAKLGAHTSLINDCKYTLAVIKETLRLFPPGGTLRFGLPNTVLTDRNGTTYPTEGLGASIIHQFVHVNPRCWPRAEEFLPERWLVEPGHALYPPANGSYRPFEHGPRNCIGQTLVFAEMKIFLVLVAREFAFRAGYEEWEGESLRQEGALRKGMRARGLLGTGMGDVEGEKAYQTSDGGSHPAKRYPCLVSLAAG